MEHPTLTSAPSVALPSAISAASTPTHTSQRLVAISHCCLDFLGTAVRQGDQPVDAQGEEPGMRLSFTGFHRNRSQ